MRTSEARTEAKKRRKEAAMVTNRGGAMTGVDDYGESHTRFSWFGGKNLMLYMTWQSIFF